MSSLDKTDGVEEGDFTSFLRVVTRLQTPALVVFGVLLAGSVLVAPLAGHRLGGLLSANAVLVYSVLLGIVAIVGTIARLRETAGTETPDCSPRADKWARVGIFMIFLVFLNGFVIGSRGLTHWGIVIGHDEPQYFAYLHSWVFDRDVRFEDEYKALPGAWKMMSDNHPERPDYNVAPIGTPVLWLPFYLGALAYLGALRALGVVVPVDGMSAPYAFAAALGSHVLVWLAMLMLYRTLRSWFSPKTSFFTITLLWTATPLIWYLTEQPWMSHAASFFAVAVVFCWWADSRGQRTTRGWVALGASIGLATLVRPDYIVLLLLPIADVVMMDRGARGRALAGLITLAGVTAVAVSPQIVTHAIRENWLHNGIHFPPGSPMEWTHPHFMAVLFSAHHGLFPWHPVLLFAFLGIPLLWRKSTYVTVCAALVLAIDLYTNAAIQAWWAGGSFGSRRLIGIMPLLAPGLAAFGAWAVHIARKRPVIPVAGMVAMAFVYNLTLVRQVREGMTDSLLPVSFQQIWSNSATLFHNMFGNPFTYPASLWFAYENDVSPAQYDVATGVPPKPDMSKAGFDIQPYLGAGWNRSFIFTSQNHNGFLATEPECTLLLYLAWGDSYHVKMTLAPPTHMETDQSASFDLNGRDLGSATLEKHAKAQLTLTIPKEAVHQGLNVLRLRFGQMLTINRKGVGGEAGGTGFPMESSVPLQVAASIYNLEVERAKPGEPPSPAMQQPAPSTDTK